MRKHISYPNGIYRIAKGNISLPNAPHYAFPYIYYFDKTFSFTLFFRKFLKFFYFCTRAQKKSTSNNGYAPVFDFPQCAQRAHFTTAKPSFHEIADFISCKAKPCISLRKLLLAQVALSKYYELVRIIPQNEQRRQVKKDIDHRYGNRDRPPKRGYEKHAQNRKT